MDSSKYSEITLEDFKWTNEPKDWFIKDESLQVCVEADFTHLYDQAGLMIYFDDKHWLKAGIEYNDGQLMVASVLTNELSDWGTGVFTGNPRKFYLRLSRKGDVVCVKYSADKELWTLLRLCPLPGCTRGPCLVCVEAEFSHLYDQAGLMIYFDDKHWLKAGIEYMQNGQPMIGSVLTNERSDWSTGVFTGNPRKFYLRLSRKGDVVCVKYSADKELWTLLRLCPLPDCTRGPCVVGPMCCTPTRQGLQVTFSDIRITVPTDDMLHSN
ncbi:hypothetical protein HF086_016133 [Spodoptera exigua]|uniref:Regulation of enolase protein 1 n=1 Tax=Spodoptera exigua TaxID=7107 RepID=A0A922ME78_SPOEX|nr:hypothetical protein HF086_016133 [Spodoptera exigua]